MNDDTDRLYQNASSLIWAAHEIHESLGMSMDIDDFDEAFVFPTREFGEPRVMQFFKEYEASVHATGEENGRDQRFLLVRLACAHVGEALRFADEGFRDDAWESLVMAQYTTAKLAGVIEGEKKIPESTAAHIKVMVDEQTRSVISERARKAADKTHVANRATRDDAFAWLDAHFIQDRLTNDRAAEQLGKIVPMELSTRLSYVKNWKRSR